MSKRDASIEDNVLIEIRDTKTERLIETISDHNLVVNGGLNLLRDLLGGVRNAEPNFIALGENNTSPQPTNVTLGSEKYRAAITRRVQGSQSINFQLFVPQLSGNGFTYEEAGLFNVRNGVSTLFARIVFTPVVKSAAVTISLSWSVTLSAA